MGGVGAHLAVHQVGGGRAAQLLPCGRDVVGDHEVLWYVGQVSAVLDWDRLGVKWHYVRGDPAFRAQLRISLRLDAVLHGLGVQPSPSHCPHRTGTLTQRARHEG